MPQAIFCVDAGGTRCRGRLVDADGATLAEAQDGPCNPTTDLAQAVASLSGLWRACGSGRDPAASVLAIGGAGLLAPAVRSRFLEAIPGFADAVVMTDGYAALIGAGGGRPCGLVIAGTGVVAHRLLPDGRSIIRDGWGWVAGDRGSGAWIGRKALRHAVAAQDGVLAHDELTHALLAAVGAGGGGTQWLVGLGPERLAALAPLVLDAAAAGHAAAGRILVRAAAHLAALARALQLPPGDKLFVVGGLAAALRSRLAALLDRPIAEPAADALEGCRLVAAGLAPRENLLLTPQPAGA